MDGKYIAIAKTDGYTWIGFGTTGEMAKLALVNQYRVGNNI